jgi:thioredoxin-related protein
MKKLLFIILLGIASIPFINAQSSKVNWVTFEDAVKLNEANPKSIFIDVYAEWCGPCKLMDKNTFSDTAVAKILNEHFYPVKFNAESKDTVKFGEHTYVYDTKNRVHQLAIALLQGKMAYPSVAYMNDKNQLLTVVPGYQKPDDIKLILKYFGEWHYKTITWNDYLSQQTQTK